MEKKINLTEVVELALILIALCVVGYFGMLNDKKDATIVDQQKTIQQQIDTIDDKQAEIDRLNMVSNDWMNLFMESLRTQGYELGE